MFGKLARMVTAQPWVVIAVWVLAGVAAVVFAPGLASVTNSDQSAFLPGNGRVGPRGRSGPTRLPRHPGRDRGDRCGPGRPRDPRPRRHRHDRSPGRQRPPRTPYAGWPSTRSARSRRTTRSRSSGCSSPPPPRTSGCVARSRPSARLCRRCSAPACAASMTGQAAIVVDNKQAFADAEKHRDAGHARPDRHAAAADIPQPGRGAAPARDGRGGVRRRRTSLVAAWPRPLCTSRSARSFRPC